MNPRWAFFIKKTSTARAGDGPGTDMTDIDEELSSYLDETTKTKAPTRGYIDKTGKRVKPKILTESVRYLSKEKRGRINIGGFLRREVVERAGKSVHAMSNEEIIPHLQAIWKDRIAKKRLKKLAHKLVLSMHPEWCQWLELVRQPVDEILLEMCDEVLSGYVTEFYPGQNIGYALGIHHDREHIHAHVMLFPQTEQGKGLCISHWVKTRQPDGTYKRIDYQGWLKAKVEQVGIKMYHETIRRQRTMASPAAVKVGQSPTAPTREQLLSAAAWRHAKPGPNRAREAVGLRRNFSSLPPSSVRPILAEGQRQYRQLTPQQAIALRTKTPVLRRQIRDEAVRAITNPACAWPARRQFSQDLFRARGVILGAHKVGFGTRAFHQSPIGLWWRERAREDNVLGRWMTRAQAEVETKFPIAERSAGLTGKKFAWARKRELLQRQLLELDQVQRYQKADFAAGLAAVTKARSERRAILEAARIRLDVADVKMHFAQTIQKASPVPAQGDRLSVPPSSSPHLPPRGKASIEDLLSTPADQVPVILPPIANEGVKSTSPTPPPLLTGSDAAQAVVAADPPATKVASTPKPEADADLASESDLAI